jgi:hypothetical protein
MRFKFRTDPSAQTYPIFEIKKIENVKKDTYKKGCTDPSTNLPENGMGLSEYM